ncbi:hypothetical protein V493_03066, partial [Pseudogymnoascus sp. VKM F-4281 (FW-2241)]
MNTSSSPTSPLKQHMSANMYHQDPSDTADLSEGPPSSPFGASANQSENSPPAKQKQETASPSPTPASRNSVTSPLKMLKIRSIQSEAGTPQRSPRKISSPDRRFPVRVAPLSPPPETQAQAQAQPQSPPQSQPQPQPQPRHIQETTLTINDVLRDNEGLTKAIQILEDEDSDNGSHGDYADAESGFDDTVATRHGGGDDEGFADETAFSAFSAVPDMTILFIHARDVASADAAGGIIADAASGLQRYDQHNRFHGAIQQLQLRETQLRVPPPQPNHIPQHYQQQQQQQQPHPLPEQTTQLPRPLLNTNVQPPRLRHP